MRVQQQVGYVLHSRPYSETSLILDVFTQNYGRLALIAKGARRLKSTLRGLLLPFQALSISWSGKGQLPTLSAAEADGFGLTLRGDAWVCGCYMNELLMRILHRYDPHETLYRIYSDSVARLLDSQTREQTLRLFEKHLLRELGYALVLDTEADGRTPIDAEAQYRYIPEHGPRLSRPSRDRNGLMITGKSLLALSRGVLDDADVRDECKRLNRAMLDRQLEGRTLGTRRLMRRLRTAERAVVKSV